MNAIWKYVWIAYTSGRSNAAYAGELMTRTVFMAVILYIFSRLWTVVYAESNMERLGGLTLQQMIWYLVITEAIAISTTGVSIEVDEDVRTGRLATELLRPLSYPLYRLAHTLGERFVRFFINLLAGAIVATVLTGPLRLTAGGLAMFALVLPMAFVLEFLGFFLIGLCAFWLENTSGLTLIYSRAGMILGGLLLPIEMFPENLQAIVRTLPFASITYAPARLFVAPDAGLFTDVVMRQGLAVGAFAAAVALVQSMALKRLQANGG
jgi:ABC-2 type transport system permease protein